MKRSPSGKRGSLLVTMTLLLLLLVPVVLVFARWMLVHRKEGLSTRVHVRQYYAASGSAEVALRRLQSAHPAWKSGMSQEYMIHVDTNTPVSIRVSTLDVP